MVMVHGRHILKLLVYLISSSCIIMRLEGAVLQNDECNVTRCGQTEIRFPFYLKDRGELHKEDHCVYPPGFQLSCRDNYDPVIEFEYQVNTSLPGLYLSFSVEAFVVSIDYSSRELQLVSLSLNVRTNHHYSYNYLSNSPFRPFTLTNTPLTHFSLFDVDFTRYFNDYTFYNCSSQSKELNRYASGNSIMKTVSSISGHGYQVYAMYSHFETAETPLTSCTKMYNFSNVPYNIGGLTWSRPDCGDCESKGQYCKFKPNSTLLTQCYLKREGHSSHKLLLTGKVGGIFLVLLAFLALCYATKSYKQNKRYQSKIAIFLKDYKALKPSRYSYADIKKISNQFKVKIGEGGYGSVFKGQLSSDVAVAVKVLNDKVDAKGSGEDFINEVSTIGLVHHVNVVRLVGYCADGYRRALVYEFLPNNSLDR